MKEIIIVVVLLMLSSPVFAMTAEEKLADAKLDLIASELNQLKLRSDVEKAKAEADALQEQLEATKAELEALKIGSGVPVIDTTVYGE